MRPLFLLSIATLAGCTTLLHSGLRDDTSSDFEPPQSWVAGVNFQFVDSTYVWVTEGTPPTLRFGAEVEFYDGRRHRRVRGPDLFTTDANELRTPWYRIWMPNGLDYPLILRITIGDPQGERTVSEYPLNVVADQFYQIRFSVSTNDPHPRHIWIPHDLRGYPVPAGARTSPRDSLWIGWVVRGRECFGCPS
jgi:hypothetical protein